MNLEKLASGCKGSARSEGPGRGEVEGGAASCQAPPLRGGGGSLLGALGGEGPRQKDPSPPLQPLPCVLRP